MIDMRKPSNLPPKPHGSPSEVSKAVRLAGRAWSFKISRNRDKDPLNICTAYINILCVYQCVSAYHIHSLYIYIYIFVYTCVFTIIHIHMIHGYTGYDILLCSCRCIYTQYRFNTIQPLLLVMNLWLLLSDAPLGRACRTFNVSETRRRFTAYWTKWLDRWGSDLRS